jgi:hypothetical protein
MIYNRLINRKNLYSNPMVAIVAKISYDSIFYGNMKTSMFISALMCYFGAMKLGELCIEIFPNFYKINQDNHKTNINTANSSQIDSEYQRVNDDNIIEKDNEDFEEILHDVDTIVKRSQVLIKNNT